MAELSIWSSDRIDGYHLCACGKPAQMGLSSVSIESEIQIQNAVIHLYFTLSGGSNEVGCAVQKTARNDFLLTVPKSFEDSVREINGKGKRAYLTADVWENGVYLGNLRDEVYCVIDTDIYKPIIVSTNTSMSNVLSGKILKGHSTAYVTVNIDRSMLFGASISSVEVTIGSVKQKAQNSIFSLNKYTTTFSLPATGSFTPAITVTDSRGVTAIATGDAFIVSDYKAPEITSMLVQRSLANGNIDDNGLYIAMTAKFNYHAVSGSNSISATQVYTKARNESTYKLSCSSFSNNTKVVFGGSFSVNKGYDIKVVVTDKAGVSATYVDYITTGSVGLELYRNQAAAFGKPVELTDGLELAEKWNFYAHENAFVDKDLFVSGNAYVNGKEVGFAPDIYTVGEEVSKPLFTITGMQNGSFVLLDIVFFSLSGYVNNMVLEKYTVLLYRKTTYVEKTVISTLSSTRAHVVITKTNDGAVFEQDLMSMMNDVNLHYKINSFITNHSSVKPIFNGTKI